MQETEETQVRSLDREDPPEEGTATHSSVLAGESQTEEPGGLQATGPQRVGQAWSDWAHMNLNIIPRKAEVLLAGTGGAVSVDALWCFMSAAAEHVSSLGWAPLPLQGPECSLHVVMSNW